MDSFLEYVGKKEKNSKALSQDVLKNLESQKLPDEGLITIHTNVFYDHYYYFFVTVTKP